MGGGGLGRVGWGIILPCTHTYIPRHTLMTLCAKYNYIHTQYIHTRIPYSTKAAPSRWPIRDTCMRRRGGGKGEGEMVETG